jgi:hypothetical protein
MAEIEKTEFEFPDEKENPRKGGRVIDPDPQLKIEMDDSSDAEIEVVDDTPTESKRHKKMDDAPKDLDEEELNSYGEKVRKRLQHLQKGYHEEKRKAEQADREREEAIRAAQLIADENKKLKGSLSQGQSALIEQSKKVLANELDQAKRQYREAYESGDSEALVNAQENLTAVKIKAERAENFRPAPLQEQENEVKTQQVNEPPVYVDRKAQKWRENNSWFGDDDEMTSFALGVHAKLAKQGVDLSSDEYYERVNARMRQVFPDYFESDEPADEPEKEVKRQKSNVVAPATRSSSPKKVVLSQTQVNIAKRLGVPLELYARKVAEQMRS